MNLKPIDYSDKFSIGCCFHYSDDKDIACELAPFVFCTVCDGVEMIEQGDIYKCEDCENVVPSDIVYLAWQLAFREFRIEHLKLRENLITKEEALEYCI